MERKKVKYPEFEYLLFQVEDGVARVHLNRPDKKNAMIPDLYRELGETIRLCEYDDTVDLIVFEGVGGNFSSGGDLSQVVEYLDELDSGNPLPLYRFTDSLPFEIFRRNSKVTIAKIEGWCAGGGLMLMSSCDLIVAAESAKFAVLEGRAGIGEGLTYPLLTARISPAKANLMIYTGAPLSGTEAERVGLVSIVAPEERLEEAIQDLITRIRKTTPDARRYYKQSAASFTPAIPNPGPGLPLDAPDLHEKLRRWARH